MKYRNCYLCESSKLEVVSKKAKFGLPITNVICKECGLVFQNPIMDENELPSFYKNEDYTRKHYDGSLENILNNFIPIAEMQYNYITKNYNIKIGKLLDIGTGVGAILHVFNKKGFHVEGIEPDPVAANFIKKKFNYIIYNDLFENINLKNKYDIITVTHILEHVVDPVAFLEKVREVINENGIVFIEVPDIDNIYPYFDRWYEWFDEGHLYSFSINTLKAALLKTSYEVLAMQRDNVYEWGVLRAIIKPRDGVPSGSVTNISDYERVKKSISRTKRFYIRRFYFIRKTFYIIRRKIRSFFKLLFEARRTLIIETVGKLFYQPLVNQKGDPVPLRRFFGPINQGLMESGKSPIWILTRQECIDYWSSCSNELYYGADRPENYAKKTEGVIHFLHEFWSPQVHVDDSILELGSNCGGNLNYLRKLGYSKLSGIEVNQNAIEEMKRTFPELANSANISIGMLEDLLPKAATDSVDVIFTMAVLIHVHPTSNFLFSQMVRVARKYICTIEAEASNYTYVFARNYRRVFQRLGCPQLKCVLITKEAFYHYGQRGAQDTDKDRDLGDLTGYVARLFSTSKER